MSPVTALVQQKLSCPASVMLLYMHCQISGTLAPQESVPKYPSNSIATHSAIHHGYHKNSCFPRLLPWHHRCSYLPVPIQCLVPPLNKHHIHVTPSLSKYVSKVRKASHIDHINHMLEAEGGILTSALGRLRSDTRIQ